MGKKIAAGLFAILFIISTCMVLKESDEGMKAEKQRYILVSNPKRSNTNESESAIRVAKVSKQPARSQMVEEEIKEYQKTDHNLYGWLEMKDTPINYPVMQGATSDYWLSHTPDRESNGHGSIYREDYSTENCTYLSGHSMIDGSMFGYLNKNQSKLLGKEILLSNERETIKANVVKTLAVPAEDEDLIRSIEEGTFLGYAEVDEKRTVVLMCCEYSHQNGRLFVICQ